MKKILLVLLSVCGCVALAQKNAPLTRTWVTPAPVTNTLVTNALVAKAPVTNVLTTRALIMNALATPAFVTNPPVKTAPVVSAPVVSTPVVSTPVVSTPVVSTPVVSTPVVSTPVVSTPAVSTPVVSTPVVSTPITNALVNNKPATNTSVTNTSVTNAPATNAPAILDISSVSWYFDQSQRQTVYCGHVRVIDGQMRLTCELLTAFFPTNNARHLERVQAETNVVIDFTDEQGEKYHVTAAQAVYVYNVANSMTNETVTLTGSPKITLGTNFVTGEPLVYTRVNRLKGMLSGSNVQSRILQPAANDTNASPLKLF